jgi:hypothetical protein
MTANGVSAARRVRTGAAATLVALAALVGGCGTTDKLSADRPPRTITTVHPDVIPEVQADGASPAAPAPATTSPAEAAPVEGTQSPPTTAPSPAEPAPNTGGFVSHGGPVRDHVSLVDNLRGRGLAVTPSSSVGPLLTAPGTVLDVSGAGIGPASLQSYDYPSAEAAAADMAAMTGGGISVMWMGPPHLFLRERAFVTYIGSDQALVSLLTEILGAEIPAR